MIRVRKTLKCSLTITCIKTDADHSGSGFRRKVLKMRIIIDVSLLVASFELIPLQLF